VLAARLGDRAYHACVLAPLAWMARPDDPGAGAVALLAVGTSFLAAYERARGAALGFRVPDRALLRAALHGCLAGGLLSGGVEPALWAFLALSVGAAAGRARAVGTQARRAEAAAR
jgi:hypothetical protein